MPTPVCYAQTLGPDGVYYTRQPAFRIPFQADANDRRIRQVQLYVSEDQGRTWQQGATARPEDQAFTFQAQRDGVFWFAVRTADADGRHNPATLDQLQATLKVCVDTQPPKVLLQAQPAPAGSVSVEWQVRDDSPLDLDSHRLEYAAANSNQWQPLSAA